MKRRGFMLAAVATPLCLSGCFPATRGLNNTINEKDYRDYQESIDSVLITADGSKLVFLGQKFHYVFDAPAHFAELLESPLDQVVEADIGRFIVEGNDVSGSVTITLKDGSADQLRLAKELGFSKSGPSDARMNLQLKGKRYSAEGFDMSKVNKKLLRRSYEVTVTEVTSNHAKKVLYVLTPLTVAADGALLLLGVPLMGLLLAVIYH